MENTFPIIVSLGVGVIVGMLLHPKNFIVKQDSDSKTGLMRIDFKSGRYIVVDLNNGLVIEDSLTS